ncbi:putative glucosylceramidase 2 isoform X1 [Tetranychus urticae]|uniref:Glucosylceramidase n=1 Tax=Tetranychus urticae TaxID=32264 RepID=T1K6S9_TETUR|nr:putative glucosylceramidase 2 isoform X1 [Tetranychus urticae]
MAFKMFTKNVTFFILCLNLIFISGSFGCQVKKNTKTDSFVCVCNHDYCDPLPVEPFSSPQSLTIFTTDKSYYRLTKSVVPESDLKVNQYSDIKVTLNVFDRFQSIIGFGGAFTDATGININRLTSGALKDRLIADYFGKDGAEYNIGRVPIGGADFSDRIYSYDDDVVDDFELKHFALAPDDYDYKIPYIKKAQQLNSNIKLFASPWSPPKWMKTSNQSEGLGILKGEPGSIYWKTYANYLIKFLESYKANAVEFWGLTPQNEPLTGLTPYYRFNTLGFSPYMMKEFIRRDLGPALKAAGYGPDKLKLMIHDHNTDEVYSFARNILSDAEAASYVSGVAYHWYDGHFYDELNKVHDNFPDYFILSTEVCEGAVGPAEIRGVTLGNWTRAETYAYDVIEGLNHWSTGWVDWNLALDTIGGPNWVGNIVDAPIVVSDDGTEYYKQPMFYSLAHFSKFLKPGSQRIYHQIDEGRMDGVKMTTFVTPTNDLVIIVVNTNPDSVQITFNGAGPTKFTLDFGPSSIQTIVKPLSF